MSELYGKIGESNPEYLLADPQGAERIGVPCTPGKGVVKRGTVMYREDNGMYSPAASANVVNTNMLVVLDEEVDTGEAPASGATAVAENGSAFRAGRFIDGKVFLTGDAALTAAHKVILRQQGILFSPMESTATFKNTVSGT